MQNIDQMELGLAKNNVCRSKQPRRRQISRSQWWFEQMHQAVERAVDWKEVKAGSQTQLKLLASN